MASYFTVNIALHFLFNWKIEKSSLFKFQFSSSNDRIGMGGNISSIISRAPFLKQFSRTSVTPDRAVAGGTARGDLLRCRSEEKSAPTGKKLQMIVPLPQNSNKTDPYIILNDTRHNNPVVRGSSIMLMKGLSENSLNENGSMKIANAKTITSGGGGTLNSLLSNDNYQILFGQSDHMRSDSYEEKPHLDILSPRSKAKATVYTEVRRSRKESIESIALRPFMEEKQRVSRNETDYEI